MNGAGGEYDSGVTRRARLRSFRRKEVSTHDLLWSSFEGTTSSSSSLFDCLYEGLGYAERLQLEKGCLNFSKQHERIDEGAHASSGGYLLCFLCFKRANPATPEG